MVWHGINNDDPDLVFFGARGFLFFSHFFWLCFVPLASLTLETNSQRKVFLAFLTLFGGLYGASLYLPLLFGQNLVTVEVVRHSIEYKTSLIYEGWVGRPVVRALYSLIIVFSLVLSSDIQLRLFGGCIIVSVLFADWFFGYAFISVWCFSAAVFSLFIVIIMYNVKAEACEHEATELRDG